MKKKTRYKGIIFILMIFIISFLTTTYYLFKNFVVELNNEEIINYILTEDNEINLRKIATPEFIFEYAFGFNEDNDLPVINIDDDINYTNDNEPIVYIYNTHDTEKYSYKSFEIFNINPTVVTSSYILSEYLSDQGIKSVVEEDSSADIVISNNWAYSQSYIASRILLEKAYEDYPNLEYFIDIHRDSSSYDATTTEINGKDCARFLFVVGMEHDNYESNLELTNKVNNKLNSMYPNYTRGISKKSGDGVNGVYNQDFHPNTILIEVGGQYNSIEEVNCSLVILSEVLASVIEGDDDE